MVCFPCGLIDDSEWPNCGGHDRLLRRNKELFLDQLDIVGAETDVCHVEVIVSIVEGDRTVNGHVGVRIDDGVIGTEDIAHTPAVHENSDVRILRHGITVSRSEDVGRIALLQACSRGKLGRGQQEAGKHSGEDGDGTHVDVVAIAF